MSKGKILIDEVMNRAKEDLEKLSYSKENMINDSDFVPNQLITPVSYTGEKKLVSIFQGIRNVWRVSSPPDYFAIRLNNNQSAILEEGKCYTFSIDVYVEGNSNSKEKIYLSSESGGYIDINETITPGSWNRISVTTKKIQKTHKFVTPHFNFRNRENVYISFKMKLESSEEKSNWTPSSEDLGASPMVSHINNLIQENDVSWRKTLSDYNSLKVGNQNLIKNSSGLLLKTGSGGFSREYGYVDVSNSYWDILNDTTISISFDIEMVVKTEDPWIQIYNSNRKGPIYFEGKVIKLGSFLKNGTVKERIGFTTRAHFREEKTTNTNAIEFYSNYGSSNFFEISNLKLELGSKSTPWTPSYYEIDANPLSIVLSENYYRRENEISEIRNFLLGGL